MKLTNEQVLMAEKNINLARHLTMKYIKDGIRNYNYDEVFSIFLLGLCKACLTFDPSKGKFSTYAGKCMINELRMNFRKEGKQERYCERSHLFIEDEDGKKLDIRDCAQTDGLEFERELNDLVIADALRILSKREKDILKMRFYYDLTQEIISCRLGISRSYCSRIEKKVLIKLRKYLT